MGFEGDALSSSPSSIQDPPEIRHDLSIRVPLVSINLALSYASNPRDDTHTHLHHVPVFDGGIQRFIAPLEIHAFD